MPYVLRDRGFVVGVAANAAGDMTERVADDDPDLLAFLNRDMDLPWPDYHAWSAAERQSYDSERAIEISNLGRRSVVLLIKLVDELLDKGVIVAADFDAETRAEYQQIKALVDQFRP